jgi:cell filamentation protein
LSNDKYGSDQAPDCYPGTDVLVNLLDLRNAEDLDEAERYINEVASARLEFIPPPYSLATLKRVHRTLFEAIYPWAGEIRELFADENPQPVNPP